MKKEFKGKAGRWFVVGGLLLLISIASVGYLQAFDLTAAELQLLYEANPESAPLSQPPNEGAGSS